MPFTLSHPLAVLPLLRGLRGRGPLVASGLVAGSMAPDVPFFAESWLPGVFGHGELTHRWWAVPTVDVALAAALVAGWHGVARRPLLALLPESWAGAALAATASDGRRPDLPAFALSAAVGAATHVGWDAFTHEGRAGVRLLPVLTRPVGGVPLCTVLQFASSAVALGYLGRYLARELPRPQQAPPQPAPGPSRAAGRTVVGLAALLGAGHRVSRAAAVRGPAARRDVIAEICFGAGAGAVAGVVALAVRGSACGRWRTAG